MIKNWMVRKPGSDLAIQRKIWLKLFLRNQSAPLRTVFSSSTGFSTFSWNVSKKVVWFQENLLFRFQMAWVHM